MKSFSIEVDGLKLPADLHKPSKYIGCPKTVIICHGFRGTKDGGGGRALALANQIADIGMSVIRFSFTPIQPLSRQIKELCAIVEYCRKNVTNDVILLGRSMGGSAALAFAATDKKIKGLCLWATPWNLRETFRLSLGSGYDDLVNGKKLFLSDEYGELKLTPEFIYDFDHFDLLKDIQALDDIPILILHGSDDSVVPLHQAKVMWEHAREPKQLSIISGGDHQFSNHGSVAANYVISWLRRWFDGI